MNNPKPFETIGDYFARQEIKPTKVEVLRFVPGDILVITCAHRVTSEQRQIIQETFKQHFGLKVMVLHEGDSLKVLRNEDVP